MTILVPDYWENVWSNNLVVAWQPQIEENGRFRVKPLPVTHVSEGTQYLFKSVDAGLRQLQPDVIYVVQEELSRVLWQMLIYRKMWTSQAKLLFFSWNNLRILPVTWKQRLVWWSVRRCTDLAIAGNSEVKQVIQRAGYQKSVIVQTEIGIDETVFKPNPVIRARKRTELQL